VTWTTTLWLDDVAPADHETEGLDRLISALHDKPRVQEMLRPFLVQVGLLEDLAVDVLTLRSIWTATGEQLDTLGRIVGQLRGGLTDAEYRLMILGRIFVNRGDGTVAQFDQILALLEIPTFAIYERFPATFEVNACGEAWVITIADLLFDLKPGGVMLRYVRSVHDEDELFTLGSDPSAVALDADRGLDSLGGGTGGMFPDMRWIR
jgi:hypothetical protein